MATKPDSSQAQRRNEVPPFACDAISPRESHSLVTGSSDAELIATVLGGDIDSLTGLVRRYQDTCARFAVRMLGSRLDTDDVLQSVFRLSLRRLRGCYDP